jgi:hypothetical protein
MRCRRCCQTADAAIKRCRRSLLSDWGLMVSTSSSCSSRTPAWMLALSTASLQRPALLAASRFWFSLTVRLLSVASSVAVRDWWLPRFSWPLSGSVFKCSRRCAVDLATRTIWSTVSCPWSFTILLKTCERLISVSTAAVHLPRSAGHTRKWLQVSRTPRPEPLRRAARAAEDPRHSGHASLHSASPSARE